VYFRERMLSDPFDATVDGLSRFLGSTGGRDKLGKFVHYGARGLAGFAADKLAVMAKNDPSREFWENFHSRMRSLFVRIMDSRRTVRWLSSLPLVITLRDGKNPWSAEEYNLYKLASLGMLWWHGGDHIRWLQQIGWLPGDQAHSKRISFAGFVLASLINTAHYLSEVRHESKHGIGKEADDKRKRNRLDLIKHFVTLTSTLHISELVLSSEWLCGLCGAIASGIDIYQLFPRKKID